MMPCFSIRSATAATYAAPNPLPSLTKINLVYKKIVRNIISLHDVTLSRLRSYSLIEVGKTILIHELHLHNEINFSYGLRQISDNSS